LPYCGVAALGWNRLELGRNRRRASSDLHVNYRAFVAGSGASSMGLAVGRKNRITAHNDAPRPALNISAAADLLVYQQERCQSRGARGRPGAAAPKPKQSSR
jgi:hypothetical protein